MTEQNKFTKRYAQELDRIDPLKEFSNRFVKHDPELIYLDGNSLGRLSKDSIPLVETVLHKEWGQGMVRSWGEGWFKAPQRIGEKLSGLVGAGPGQVVISDTTSINLFKLVMAALDFNKGKTRIISDVLNFPSDLYIVQGCMRLLGDQHSLELVPAQDSINPDLDVLYDMIDENTALVTLSHVVFKSGYLYDAAEITRKAHEKGALVLWDLSHAVGAVPIELDQWDVDLAIGCTYKYLNGGPGSPAFLYVRKELQERMLSPLWGWFGQEQPFAFGLDYQPAEGIDRFLCSSPSILSMYAVEAALEIVLEAGMPALREKSVQQSEYLIGLFDHFLEPIGFVLGSPRDVEKRGSHVSIRHADGYRINQALIEEMKVIPDFREPDNIRLGITPLYTSFEEIWEAVERMRRVVEEGLYEKYFGERKEIT
ncbi:MAG: kynureninase [Anaerolineaceae bacterium]|nr:kynureninase [Anaerolineaceae bacterium]